MFRHLLEQTLRRAQQRGSSVRPSKRAPAATEAALAGLTDEELKATGGWNTVQQARYYVDEDAASREKNGESASRKRIANRPEAC